MHVFWDTSLSLQLYRGHVRDLLDMLRACVRSTPSLLGSTVWGMTDIHKVLCSLAPAQKEKLQPLYFVKVGFCPLVNCPHVIWWCILCSPNYIFYYNKNNYTMVLVHVKWVPFFLLNSPSFIHFLITKVDVSGAYESLPHDKLIEVISQALSPVQDELFTIRRYAKIWADSHEGLRKSFVRQVPSYPLIHAHVCLSGSCRDSHFC